MQVPAGQCLKQFGNDDVLLGVVTQWKVWVNAVNIAATGLPTRNVASLLKVGNNFVGGSFSYPDTLRDLTSGARGIVRNIAKHESVVRDEGPP